MKFDLTPRVQRIAALGAAGIVVLLIVWLFVWPFWTAAALHAEQVAMLVELLRSAGYTAKYQLGQITLTGTQFNDWFGITNATAARKLLADGGTPATVSDNGSTVTSVTMMHVWVIATISGTPYAFDPAFKSHTVTTGIDVAAAMGFGGGTQFLNDALVGATVVNDGMPRVHTLNRTGVRGGLSGYATTLLNYIKNNHANSAIEDIIGGRAVAPYTGGPLRQTSLPNQAGIFGGPITADLPVGLRTRVSLYLSTTLTLNWNLNDIYGKQIAVELNETNPLPTQGVATYRVLLGEDDVTGWVPGTGTGGSVTVNHPYAAGTSAGVVNGAYMDKTTGGVGAAVGSVQIIIASGRPSSDLASWQERNHTARQAFTTYNSGTQEEPPRPYPQQIATRRRMATTLLIQLHEMAKLVAGVGNSEILVHDIVGVVSGIGSYGNAPGPMATSFVASVEPAISAISKSGDAAQPAKVVRTFATMTSALEGSITQQIADATYPVSAVAQLDWANSGPTAGNRWYYVATSANWASVKSQILTNYHAITNENSSPMRDQAETFINAGYTVFIPRSSSLGPAPEIREKSCQRDGNVMGFEDYHRIYNEWTEINIIVTVKTVGFPNVPITYSYFDTIYLPPPSGFQSVMSQWRLGLLPTCVYTNDPDRAGAFIAIHPTTGAIAHISSRENSMGKGGGGTNDVDTNPSRVFALPSDFLDKQFSARAGAQNVDLKSGTLEYTPPPDIVAGNGGYPYSLSFQRSYRSGAEDYDTYVADGETPELTRARDPIFGFGGWTSNIHHNAVVTTDATQVFGRDDPRAAAQSIVAVQALLSLTGNGATDLETLQRQITGAFVATWWNDTLALNAITVNQGHATQSFVKLADGTYVQRGSAQVAELIGERTLWAPPARSHGWVYKTCVKLIGASREVSYYGGWNGGNSNCVGPPDDPRFRGDGNIMGFVKQTFPYGVTVTWNETTKTLSNNLGRSLTVSGVGNGGTVTDGSRTVVVARDGATISVTDTMGRVWGYPDNAGVFEVRPPSTPNTPILRVEYAGGGLGVVDKIKDALGNTTTFNIGGGRASSVVDPLGNATRTLHDRFGNIVTVEGPLGRVARTEYDNLRRKVKATAPEGNYATYTYDARSNVLTETQHVKPGSEPEMDPDSRTVSTKTYDALCNMVLTDTDALIRTTTYAINQTTCQVTSVTAPNNGITTFAYNSIGQVSQKKDPTDLVTAMTYNTSNGTLTSVVVDPGTAPHIAATTAFTYDAVGNITQLTDPRGHVHTATYDALRRLTQYTAPTSTGAVTKWTTDLDGLVTKIERATGNAGAPWATTQYAYFPNGRVAATTDADGRVTRFTYDAASRLVLTIDPEMRQTKKVYDAASQVIEERRGVGTPAEQAYATFGYTANGKQAWIKDAKLNQTSYTYDGYDRLEKTTFPDATYEQLVYTITDTVASKRTRGNQLIVNTYDVMDRLSTHLVPQPGATPAILTTTAYDAADRPTSISDNTGHSLVYHFDSAKRIDWVDQQAPTFLGTRRVTYEFDDAGNKTRMHWPDDYNVTYDYDGLNRMTVVRESGTFVLATYIYDPLSRRTSLVYGNGASQGYTYSTQGDLLTLANTLTGISNTTTNTFTKAHQLASEASSNVAWGYVPAAFQMTSYAAANPLNQYVNITVGANPTTTLAYDANGNLTGDGIWTFAYDAQNMLRSSTSAANTSTYQYDARGRRQMLTEGGTTTTFLHDGEEEIADYSNTTVLRRYVPGPGTDMPIAMIAPSSSSSLRKYFHTNRQGSTIAMSADDGTIAEGPYSYDAFGNGAPATGAAFKYTGRRLDAGTGIYYYRARYYSASLGRFLQTDPVGYDDQSNLYAYVRNDPSNAVDPTGRDTYVCRGGSRSRVVSCVSTIEVGTSYTSYVFFYDGVEIRRGVYAGKVHTDRAQASLNQQVAASYSAVSGEPIDPFDPHASGGNIACIEGHHCIPRAVLKQLPSGVRKKVERGNIEPIPMFQHRAKDTGVHSDGYNREWELEMRKRGGPQNLTEKDVLEIDRRLRAVYGLPPR